MRMLCLTVVLAMAMGMFTAQRAAADSATAPVHLSPHAGEVTTSHAVAGHGNVAMKFSAVEHACLVFVFSDDLLDPGDELFIIVDGRDAGGFAPPGSESQATRTFCWIPELHPIIIAEFLDGKAKFEFGARGGSVTLHSVTLSITGSPR